jgi:hypothetical protein
VTEIIGLSTLPSAPHPAVPMWRLDWKAGPASSGTGPWCDSGAERGGSTTDVVCCLIHVLSIRDSNYMLL